MGRPTAFTKAMIIDAAIGVVASEGPAALTARGVAAALGSSTAPIYSTFSSIEALGDAVMERARQRLRGHTRRHWSDRPFINEGTGLVVFARDEPQLFALLFLRPEVASEAIPKIHADVLGDMKRDPRLADLPARERDQVIAKLWFTAVGMATLAYTGQLRDSTNHGILTSLTDAANLLLPASARTKPRRS